MKVAIISDTHDNLATLDKFAAYINKNPVETIIHCGDIAEGETLARLAKNFSGPIMAVLSNADYRKSLKAAAQKFPEQIRLFENFGQTKINGIKIGFCHLPGTAKRHAQSAARNHFNRARKTEFDFIFYGHTHKPWREKIGDCQLANPGNLAGIFYKATFAVLDTENKMLELKLIEKLRQK